MKTRFKTKSAKKSKYISKYKIEEKYLPYFKNTNLRNNQNYVLDKKTNRILSYYVKYTFIWGSSIRVMNKKGLKKFRNKKIKETSIILFLGIIFLILSLLGAIQFLFFALFLLSFGIFLLFILIFYLFFGEKKHGGIIFIKDKNKYIILKKGKIK